MNMLTRLRLWVFVGFALMMSAVGALAQSCTATAPPLAFGTVDTLGTAVKDSSTTLTISCTGNLGLLGGFAATIHLGDGTGGSAAGGPRRMTLTGATSNTMNYELYSDSGRASAWGGTNGTHGGSAVTLSATNLLDLFQNRTLTVPIYGRVPGGQTAVRTGAYASGFTRGQQDIRLNYRVCVVLNIGCTDYVGTGSFNVSASVSPNCRVVADDLDFGTRGVLNANVDANSAIRVTCTNATSYTIGVGYGLVGTSVSNRRMRSTLGNFVNYQLYRDAARAQPWGLASDPFGVNYGGTGGQQTYTVYGRVPPQATPRPGAYSDTVRVTITY